MDHKNLPYRRGVGLALFNDRGLVFTARRIDTDQDAWQMPQGGIDEGEKPETAALRELEEEIGTAKAEIVAEIEDWLTYDLPEDLLGKVWKGRYRGQTQKWYALRFRGSDADIDIATEHPEFSAWKWLPLAEVAEQVVPFKRDIYRVVAAEFSPLAEAIAKGR